MHSKKKLGIIGGAGPFASALLYQSVIEQSYREFKGKIPEIFLINYPFTRGLRHEESKKNQEIICSELQYCFDALAVHGVEIAAIACNTMHAFLQNLDLKEILLVHLPQCVMQEMQNNHIKKALLLSTPSTVFYRLYENPQILTVVPNEVEQLQVNAIIDRVLKGSLLQTDAETLNYLIAKIYLREPFDGVVLGCTELPVLNAKYPLSTSKTIFDSIQILAKKLASN